MAKKDLKVIYLAPRLFVFTDYYAPEFSFFSWLYKVTCDQLAIRLPFGYLLPLPIYRKYNKKELEDATSMSALS